MSLITKTNTVNNIPEVDHLNNTIIENNAQIETLYTTIGRIYFEHQNAFSPDLVAEFTAQISQLISENQKAEERISFLENHVICSECGHPNKSSAKYCIRCGNELFVPETPPVSFKDSNETELIPLDDSTPVALDDSNETELTPPDKLTLLPLEGLDKATPTSPDDPASLDDPTPASLDDSGATEFVVPENIVPENISQGSSKHSDIMDPVSEDTSSTLFRFSIDPLSPEEGIFTEYASSSALEKPDTLASHSNNISQETIICSHCGQSLPAKYKFCVHCGESLK